MKIFIPLLCLVFCLVGGSAIAQPMPDLKLENIHIEPMPAGVNGPQMQLHMSGSYRFQVTIRNVGNATAQSCFVVRTQCVRGNSAITLGEALVGQTLSPYIYAVYDVFPSSAGAGDCIIRTIVDVDHRVQELDEGMQSNVWDRGAVVLP